MEIEQFASLKGTPTMIWSDNDTNFIGGEKDLRENIEERNTLSIAAELAHKGIKWRFKPPRASQQGGFWERLVQNFKSVLYAVLDARRLID